MEQIKLYLHFSQKYLTHLAEITFLLVIHGSLVHLSNNDGNYLVYNLRSTYLLYPYYSFINGKLSY